MRVRPRRKYLYSTDKVRRSDRRPLGSPFTTKGVIRVVFGTPTPGSLINPSIRLDNNKGPNPKPHTRPPTSCTYSTPTLPMAPFMSKTMVFFPLTYDLFVFVFTGDLVSLLSCLEYLLTLSQTLQTLSNRTEIVCRKGGFTCVCV